MSAEIRRLLLDIVHDTWSAWDDDQDSRVGKLLKALAGQSPGYRADIDELHRLLIALPPAGSPPVEALVQQWRERAASYKAAARDYNHAGDQNLDAYYDGKFMATQDAIAELEAALKAAPLVEQEEDLARVEPSVVAQEHGDLSRSPQPEGSQR